MSNKRLRPSDPPGKSDRPMSYQGSPPFGRQHRPTDEDWAKLLAEALKQSRSRMPGNSEAKAPLIGHVTLVRGFMSLVASRVPQSDPIRALLGNFANYLTKPPATSSSDLAKLQIAVLEHKAVAARRDDAYLAKPFAGDTPAESFARSLRGMSYEESDGTASAFGVKRIAHGHPPSEGGPVDDTAGDDDYELCGFCDPGDVLHGCTSTGLQVETVVVPLKLTESEVRGICSDVGRDERNRRVAFAFASVAVAVAFKLASQPIVACIYAVLGTILLLDALVINVRLRRGLYGNNTLELLEVGDSWPRSEYQN